MKRSKKLLLSFLALNAALPGYAAGAGNTATLNYDRLYNNMTKNLEQGKSNGKNYELIEKALNQRNKELKNLYLQSDYIVKPEYLEWQIFAGAFYEEHGKGVDNTKENARYHSQISGYYDEDGNYVTTSGSINGMDGKPYQALQQPKNINLGVSIPMKGMTKEPLDLVLAPTGEIKVNPITYNFAVPSGVTIPQVSVIEFQPLAPDLTAPTPISVNPISLSFPGSGNGDNTWFGVSGNNAPISQQSMVGAGGGRGVFETLFPSGSTVNQYINNTTLQGYMSGHTNKSGAEHTENGYTFSGTTSFGSMLLVGGEYIPITNMDLTGLRLSGTSNLALFHTDSHNNYGSSIWDLNNTNVTLKGEGAILYDVQYHSGGSGGDSGMVFDNGTLTADNSTSYTTLYDGSTKTYAAKNRYVFVTIAATGTLNRYLYFKNESGGKIYLNGTGDTLMNFASEDSTSYGGTYFENRGTIELNGTKSMGAVFAREYTRSWVRFENALNLNGDKSVGAAFTYNFNTNAASGAGASPAPVVNYERAQVQDSVFNIKIGEKSNPSDADSNDTAILGNSTALVEEATALYFNNSSGTMKDYKIMHAQLDALEYAKRATLVSIVKGKVILDGTDTANRMKIDGGTSKTGINNIAIYAGATGTPASTQSEIESYIPIMITNSDLSTAIFGEKKAKITSAGDITISGSNGAKGIIVDSNAQATISGKITLTNGGVYTDSSNVKTGSVVIGAMGNSSLTSTGLITADVYGKESIAVYADNSTVTLQNTGSSIKALDGAFAMTAINNGTIKYAGNYIETGQKSLMFYLDNTGKIEITSPTTAKITGAANATDRGTAFYYKSPTAYGTFNSTDISTYFTNRYNASLGNLTLNMDAGSRLFIVDNVAMNLSSTNISMGSVTNAPIINGSSYKTFMLYQSDLTIDKAINLDSATDDYNNLEIVTSKITNNGFNITGTTAGQTGMAQENGLDLTSMPLVRSTVTLTNNNGIISLGGANSIGMYTSNGEIYNNGTGKINTTGDNSIGIYAVNGTKVDTAVGTVINIGKNGVGIFAEGYKQGTAQVFGDGKLDIKNSGLIKSGTGANAIGIYLNNNSGAAVSDSKLNLSNGTVDVSDSENAVGVYVNKGTITDTGSIITVGKNGVALYAKDSNVALTGATINLYGDNALGLYLDGTTSFTGTGNVNISGQNIVLFNMNSSGTISNNFNVGAITAGSSYTLGNIVGGAFKYTGNSNLASNGTLVTGKNSAIYLDGSAITSASGSTNVAAVALDGQYTGILPAGMTAGTDGDNNGIITLGDSSVGLYGKNGSRLINRGTITVANASAGVMTSGTGSSAENNGTINLGTGSQGIYLKDGVSIINTATGNIISTGTGTVGLFADNNAATVMNVTNSGIIDLGGDKSIGIYSKGAVSAAINNDTGAVIKVGASANALDPAIGIYSETAGDTITNSGTVTSGANSIGIYSSNGIVNNNGVVNTGDSGVGIYTMNGTVNLGGSSAFNIGTNGAVGVYGVFSAVTSSTNFTVGDHNYGFILKGGSFANNTGTNSTIGTDSVFMYSQQGTAVTNTGNLTMTGTDNVGFYLDKDSNNVGGAVMTNNGTITGIAGNNNVGIYNYGGTVDNYGTVSVGGSDLVFSKGAVDTDKSKYAVGIYGENAAIINHNGATVSAGYGGYGIVAKGGTGSNFGTVTTNGDYSVGMFTEGGTVTNELGGVINVTGDNAIGMAGKGANSYITNHGTINITGNETIGMYGNAGTIITNTGIINISGNGQAFVSAEPDNTSHSVGGGTATINGVADNVIQGTGNTYALPTLINAGIIKTDGVLALNGIQILIKTDISTRQPSSDPDYDFVVSGTSLIADEILTSNPIVIMPGYADGTNADVYKLEGLIQATAGRYDFVSGSLLWEATPKVTATGADIYMSRKSFTDFTDGLWFEDFGTALEKNYATATGDGIAIYNKTGYIADEQSFRNIMGSLAGNVYANINQRENDIANALENSLHLMQNSVNNTKENVKVNIIAGKGKNKEETDGVTSYDYSTTGALALREVERTYRHTFGYSLGYLHTGFEFNDGNSSEEWVDTIQLGVHNKYKANDWQLRNDLTGRVSFHNIDRNIDWPSPLGRSEMNGTYETYSITSDNILGKEFGLGKKASIMPYGAFKAMYVTRPAFSEKGLEALEVEGNDAWSVKPRAGVELKGAVPLGANTAWQLKGVLDLAYEYELADLNEREKARLVAIEDGYHNLSKPQDEEGIFRTRASIGVEVEDRYGIFLTGEYSKGNDKENDYRAGVVFKAVF
ncbi:autotransporter domain-containing protein [Sebaldella sp. S0638]|uniref:autotransporter domain-containing protein n=1 Tax=Sebaldella sp. S0638 TaxID=2957809 RepID=UPI0020A0A9FC|nr:transporter [Sebaldella sp. S0638]MCP1224254.1 transporter [Sebaldella sp. S0638]